MGRAAKLVGEALDETPGNVSFLLLAARFQAELGHQAKAEDFFLRAKDISPTEWRPSMLLGDFYSSSGDQLRALTEYRSAL